MDIRQLMNDIYDANNPENQYKAAYQMRYIKDNSRVVHTLFDAGYEAKDPKLQQEAVRSLGVLAPDEARNRFVKTTYNLNLDTRRRAYYHLGTLGDPRGTEEVLKGLLDHEEAIRKAAVTSLGRLGSDYRIINELRKLQNGFEPPDILFAVQVAIERIQKRIDNSKRRFNEKPSFNKPENGRVKDRLANAGYPKPYKPVTTYTRPQNGFTKTGTLKSYTPKLI